MQFKSMIKEDPVFFNVCEKSFENCNMIYFLKNLTIQCTITKKNISQVMIVFYNFQMSPNFFANVTTYILQKIF